MDILIINRDYHADYDAQVTGFKDITWVERYNHQGEFTMIGNPVPLQAQVPPGTWISHSLTKTIMVVEEHYIENGILTVTGRSIDAFIMDRRVILPHQSISWANSYPGVITSDDFNPFSDPASFNVSWRAVLSYLNKVFKDGVGNPEELISDLWPVLGEPFWNSSGWLEQQATDITPIKLSKLSDAIYNILQSNDTGLRVERPYLGRHAYILVPGDGVSTLNQLEGLALVIHQGNDLSHNYEMTFNWAEGDLIEPRYLWSIKNYINNIYTFNKTHLKTIQDAVLYSQPGWDCSARSLNAEDFRPQEILWYWEINDVLYGRSVRHLNIERRRNQLADAKVSKTVGPKFGIDYNIGDLVPVVGEYGISQIMRVTECAMFASDSGHEFIITLGNKYSSSYFGGG